MLEKLLSKRSYVDSSSNVLVLLQGRKAPTSAVHVPEKYSKVLRIISYRYEVYRHATVAIQGAKTSVNTELAIQKLALILHYLDNVRTAYMARARRGSVGDNTWFSPELEYHLWLDYSERAYHNTACASIKNGLGVTFKYVLEQKQPDILTFIDWDEYIRLHNVRFDMCGLGITLGQNESQAPQAARDLAKAILDDLGAVDRETISKEDAADEVVESKERRKKLAKSGMAQATDSGAKLKQPAAEKQPLVDDDQNSSGNNSEMVAASSWRGELSEAIDDDDAITAQEIDVEERQERRASKQKHSRTTHHNASPGKKGHSVIAGIKIWGTQFGQLHTFIRNRVVELCNVDINKIHDDETLEAWHRSIDVTDPHVSEILGYILLLRSTIKLEEESSHFQNAMCMIGEENRQFMVERLKGKRQSAEQSQRVRSVTGSSSGADVNFSLTPSQ
ncbi:hypothetical protein HD554DRAFT_2179398 [Boletus coccyginus]|nr:hypothetical protein HD554DRAFT_2179398 [Boletus coccyginus]